MAVERMVNRGFATWCSLYPCRAGIEDSRCSHDPGCSPRRHSQEPLTRLTDVNRPEASVAMQAPDGRLLGSQYDPRTRLEIGAARHRVGAVTRLVDGVREGRYLAENARYLVGAAEGPPHHAGGPDRQGVRQGW